MSEQFIESQTSTGAAGDADTLTVTIAPTEKIAVTGLQIYRAVAGQEAAGAVLVISTTGLPTSLTWTVGNLVAAGTTVKDVDMTFDVPLISSAAGTDVTIVCPNPGTTPIWNTRIFFYRLSALQGT